MTDEADKKPGVDPSRLDLSIGGGDTDTLDVGGKPTTKKSDGVSMDFDRDGTVTQTGIGDAPLAEGDDKKEGTKDDVADGEVAKEAPEKETSEADTNYEPLPDYAEDTAAAYEERFIKASEDGDELNTEAIADEIRANMAKAEGASERPNEGTYKFLKAKFGITKAVVDEHIEGAKARSAEITAAFHEVTGGKDVWAAKLAWAGSKEVDGKAVPGAYTKAQIDAYNAGLAAGGERATEQIELMNARFEKANPDFKAPGSEVKRTAKMDQATSTIGIKRRDASPKASASSGATNTGGGGGAKPFANAKEHREAMAAIRSLPQVEQEPEHIKVRARLAASPFYRAQQKG